MIYMTSDEFDKWVQEVGPSYCPACMGSDGENNKMFCIPTADENNNACDGWKDFNFQNMTCPVCLGTGLVYEFNNRYYPENAIQITNNEVK